MTMFKATPPPDAAPPDSSERLADGASQPQPNALVRAAKARADHPLVVTLERSSAPRVAFSGDRLVEVDLPRGTRVIYPRPPIESLKDVDAAIRYAINHPLGSEPLY